MLNKNLFEKNILEAEFPFRLFIVNSNMVYHNHYHEEIEIIYVIDGKVNVNVNDIEYNLIKRDLLIIGTRDIHYFNSPNDFSQVVVVQFKLSLFDNYSTNVHEKKFIGNLIRNSKKMSGDWHKKVKEEMEKELLLIVKEYEEKKEAYQLYIKGSLYKLIGIIQRDIPEEQANISSIKHRVSVKNLEIIYDFIENNYGRKIYLEEVAKIEGLSIFHFTRIFKKQTGTNFTNYLNNFRIKKAEWELINEDLNITEIAYKNGFNNNSSFNRIFKNIKGCSPSEFRKSKI